MKPRHKLAIVVILDREAEVDKVTVAYGTILPISAM